MPLVADTSPLIAFSAVRRLDLLSAIWGKIWIPPAVFCEVVTDGAGWSNAMAIQAALNEGRDFICHPLPETSAVFVASPKLGRGEIEVIRLSLHSRLNALIDDRTARHFAKAQGVTVIGSLGVLAIAKHREIISHAGPLVDAMRAAGIRFHPQLIAEFLRELGEC